MELVEKTGAQVVVASQFWSNIKDKCPSGTVLLRPEGLAAKGWFPMQTMPLQGRGLGSCAYRLAWEKKNVLLTGQIPVGYDPRLYAALRREFKEAKVNVAEYSASLDVLGMERPDLWLPAGSPGGQNAIVYEGDWEKVIAYNRHQLSIIGLPDQFGQ